MEKELEPHLVGIRSKARSLSSWMQTWMEEKWREHLQQAMGWWSWYHQLPKARNANVFIVNLMTSDYEVSCHGI